MVILNVFFDNLASYAGLIGLLGAAIAYIFSKLYRTKFDKRRDWQNQFNETVTRLSSFNETSQLAAAVMLRRYFKAQVDRVRFCDETIRVIASLLRILPLGVFQKTLGDGLAFAENLNYADLQRTNLQDLYLGVKNMTDDEQEKEKAKLKHEEELRNYKLNPKGYAEEEKKEEDKKQEEKKSDSIGDNWKLSMDFTDMFEANLSLTLMENIRGFGTIFYGAIMNNTQIKHCEFINCDFRGVDLMHAKFQNVKLSGSNFSGAKNLPQGLEKYLDEKGIYHEAPENEKCGFTSEKASAKDIKKVFFSMPGSLSKSDEYLTLHFKELMDKLGYKPVYYTRDHYPKSSQLSRIRREIDNSVGVIAFGLKQIQIDKGVARPELPMETNLSGHWLPTPWNDIEVGMAVMKELPVLLVKDDDIDIGVFDKMISEYKVRSISSSVDIKQIINDESFKKWLKMLE